MWAECSIVADNADLDAAPREVHCHLRANAAAAKHGDWRDLRRAGDVAQKRRIYRIDLHGRRNRFLVAGRKQ
jgi:hypothetical protein